MRPEETSEHFVPDNFNKTIRYFRKYGLSLRPYLPSLLGYVDYNHYRSNCTKADTELLRQLRGRHGYVIYKMLKARRS